MMKTDVSELVITLIEDNIVNCKLITCLDKIGIDASAYTLNSPLVILTLLGINETNKRRTALHEYSAMLRNKIYLEVSIDRTELKREAEKIYKTLKNYSES